MIKGIAHLCLTVRDLDKAIEFYSAGLGLGEAFDFRDDQGRRFGVYLHVGERTFLELFAGEHDDRDEQQSYRHMCLEVDDLAGLVEQLRRANMEVSDPKLGSDHSWQAWLTDPDGNRIELHQYTPESKQAVLAPVK